MMRLQIFHLNRELKYNKRFDKIRAVSPGDVVENKRLSHVLNLIQSDQAKKQPVKRSQSTPSRSINGIYNHRDKIAKQKLRRHAKAS